MSRAPGEMRTIHPKAAPWAFIAACVALLWPSSVSANRIPKADAAERQDSVPITSSDNLFEFHSGFWINLHHFLFEQAAIATAGPKGTPHEAELSTDSSMAAGLSKDESKTWSDALLYYREKMLHHDLASDKDMVKIKNTLEDMEGATSVDRSDLDPKLVAALDAAAPVYRAHWWFLHDKTNQAWIAALMPLVDNQGGGLAQQIATAFDTPWPNHPLRVDVVAYANYAGSYTTLDPARITISSIDGGNQGTAALEVLFHAASGVMIKAVSASVEQAYARAGTDSPPEVTQMILWFTSGFLVQQLYPNYTPYADRFPLWTENSQTGYHAALVKYWQPRLEGKMPLDTALIQLAANFWVTSAPEKKTATPAPSPAPPTK